MQKVDTVSIRILNLKRLTRIFLMSEVFKTYCKDMQRQ